MADSLNMMEVSISTFTEEIKMELEEEDYGPMVGIGKSGVGKTMSIYELTQELGIGFCELRLVTLTEVDLLGIPVVNESGRTTYASNDLLPNIERDGEAGILVLDEITSCTPTIRAAAYQLMDSKRSLGNYKLPDKWKVIALGNGIEDGGVFNGIESAFLSRGVCYRIEPNLEVWKKWALSNDVNPSVIAFLNFDPSKLHDMEPDEIAGIFPCPRSWTRFSLMLNKREKRNGGMLPPEKVELYAAGAVGNKVAPSFSAFYAYNSKTVSPEDIISGKVGGSVVKDLDTQVVYLMTQSLVKVFGEELKKGAVLGSCGEFDDATVDRCCNLCNWIVDASNYKLDVAVTCLSDLANGIPLFTELVCLNETFDDKCPNFLKFCTDANVALSPA